MEYPIDFVITWVDSSDAAWQRGFAQYKQTSQENPSIESDASNVRYRDWGLLKYWFRGVEKFAPWVRYIHFVTNGQMPDWLDTTNPKLKIVKHEDYIPKEFLPLYNSNAIELMMHRIPDLAEHFVYFNDDFFLIRPVAKEYFFKNGKPCDAAILCNYYALDIMKGITEQNMSIINKEFDIFSQIRKNHRIWFQIGYGKYLLQTITGIITHKTVAPADTHTAQPYLKSVIEKIWSKYAESLTATMTHRFRQSNDISHWMFRYWQIIEGDIEPRNIFAHTKAFYQPERYIDDVYRYLASGNKTIVVINDSENIKDYQSTKSKLQGYFKEIIPKASSFEKIQ